MTNINIFKLMKTAEGNSREVNLINDVFSLVSINFDQKGNKMRVVLFSKR